MIRKPLKALLKVLLFFKVSDLTRLASIRHRRHRPGLCARPLSFFLSLNKAGNIWLDGRFFFFFHRWPPPSVWSSAKVQSQAAPAPSPLSSSIEASPLCPNTPHQPLSAAAFPESARPSSCSPRRVFRLLVNEMPGSRSQVFRCVRSSSVRAARPLSARQDRRKWDETIYWRWIIASVVQEALQLIP